MRKLARHRKIDVLPFPCGMLALVVAAAQAQPEAEPEARSASAVASESERIVVVGTRLAADGFGPRNVIARDTAEIERSVPGDAEQLLRKLPGVSLFRPGGPGGVSEIFVRGGESNFTAVYVDGVRLNDSTNTRGGSFDFSTLPPFRIGRVEVAPGAMSAIYGSDTMAGVIRIETAWPEPGDFLARAEIGSERDWRLGLGYGYGFDNGLELGLMGAVSDAGDEIEGSRLDTADLGARLTVRRDDAAPWTLTARFNERERTSFPEVSGGPVFAVIRAVESSESEQASFSASTGWTFNDDWSAELVVSRADLREDFVSPPIAPGVLDGQPAFVTRTDYDRTEALFVNRYRFGPALHTAFGLDLVRENGRDDGFISFVGPAAYSLDRDIRSAFAEIGRNFGAGFDATMAIRADRAGARDEISGKLGLSKRLDALDGRLWATVATGFKLPSFFALGNPIYGNPNLAPEQVESLEIGFEQQAAERFGYGLSLFVNDYEDLIDFDFENFTSVNRARVDIDGVQGWMTWSLGDSVTVSADATLLSIETGEGVSTLPRRPEKMAGIAIDYSLGRGLSFTGSLRYAGSRTISSIPTGLIQDGSYELVDLALRKSSEDGLSYWVALDNVLDADYRHAPGFPAPGPHVRFGADFVY